MTAMERAAVSHTRLFTWPAYTALCFSLGVGLAVAGCSGVPPRQAEAGTAPASEKQNATVPIGREEAGRQGNTEPQAPPDELLVTFKPETTEARRQAIHQAVGVQVLSRMLGGRIAHVKLPQGQTVAEGQRAYAQFTEVVAAEPNELLRIQEPGGQRDER